MVSTMTMPVHSHDVMSLPHDQVANITVVVSGSSFNIVPSLWKSVEHLEWRTPAPQASNDYGFMPSLTADPDAFELLLQYFLFGSLPDCASLPPAHLTELKGLAVQLENVQPLIDHVDDGLGGRGGRRGSTMLARNLSSIVSAPSKMRGLVVRKNNKRMYQSESSLPVQEKSGGFSFSSLKKSKSKSLSERNVPRLEPTSSSDSEDSYIRPTSLPSVVTKPKVNEPQQFDDYGYAVDYPEGEEEVVTSPTGNRGLVRKFSLRNVLRPGSSATGNRPETTKQQNTKSPYRKLLPSTPSFRNMKDITSPVRRLNMSAPSLKGFSPPSLRNMATLTRRNSATERRMTHAEMCASSEFVL